MNLINWIKNLFRRNQPILWFDKKKGWIYDFIK